MARRPPKKPIVPQYDPKKEGATDPLRIAYHISRKAAECLALVIKLKKTKHVDGYVARHLVEKGLLVRLPGRDAFYRATLRGEAVLEVLKESKKYPYLFPE